MKNIKFITKRIIQMIFWMLGLNILLLVIGQILWKYGLGELGAISFNNLFSIIFSPFIIVGLFLYVIATVIWFYILSKTELSVVYPMQSLAYVLGILAGWLIFKENLTLSKMLGAILILAGVYLISLQK